MLKSILLNIEKIINFNNNKKQIKKVTIDNSRETEKSYCFNLSCHYINYKKLKDYNNNIYVAKSQCKLISFDKKQYVIFNDKFTNITEDFGNVIEQSLKNIYKGALLLSLFKDNKKINVINKSMSTVNTTLYKGKIN